MSAANSNDEYRRVPRRKIAVTTQVVDTMTDTVIGRLLDSVAPPTDRVH